MLYNYGIPTRRRVKTVKSFHVSEEDIGGIRFASPLLLFELQAEDMGVYGKVGGEAVK